MTRRVLVTGGGTGIGKAIAHAFAADGCHVTIAGRRREPLEAAAEGLGLEIRVADVTDEAQVEALFATSYDVVVANAGTGVAARIEDVELEEWQRTLMVNMTGTFLTFRAALRAGMEPGGRLIAIASTASLQGGAQIPAYAASKHGVLGLVRSVAQSVAKRGITCNAICPGFVDTEMAESAITGLMARHGIPREKALKMVVGGNPMQRLIAPEEVAATAVFLASEGAASVNGHAMSVSGGEI
ncbi:MULTISPECIES: SDR family NAD(P)-dependent oxidoreductase [unclassified Leisingera]|uniref:SDR family NAD(P)-dependent oxidoreductase n=1 Tax=unclassified Leisingera TaxID=2614906 RepID=UPI0002E87F91|nr:MULTISPECIES: SDR family NAD(P)-dependent oxidoreductase [unclassified Leisingera]KIC22105.1 3-hydroxyacyl-CoA dehydrogenase [Leisingera sp. ANG-S3]KIC34369.1 3-hydroxyacyl-CoA dehydrogenase [Leisingera sp. ANG-S5]KIC55152.1 3-hydroxyacyl-CoA dehydrogenase [Leisingera sp. ANG-S]KID11062.1 3-hydroxyacyl-CoA dehydrogenase [Leisingera sp. ANG1]